MGRTKVDVDENKIKDIVVRLESSGPLKNRSVLYKAVADEYNKSSEDDISHSIAMLRIQDLMANGLTIKTPKGKKGRQPGQAVSVNRTSRAEKMDKTNIKAVRAEMKSLASLSPSPDKTFNTLNNKVKRLEEGSMKAAITLMCIDCTQNDRVSIKECACTQCPLFSFRPYQ